MHQRHVISLLIHGFLSVNARLLIAFGTAFYAITVFQTWKTDSESKIVNKKEIGLPLYAIISMQINPNTFLCHPAVLDCRNLFLS